MEDNTMVTREMKELLEQISGLCYQASNEVFEDVDTKNILKTCDKLQELIDRYLEYEGNQ